MGKSSTSLGVACAAVSVLGTGNPDTTIDSRLLKSKPKETGIRRPKDVKLYVGGVLETVQKVYGK